MIEYTCRSEKDLIIFTQHGNTPDIELLIYPISAMDEIIRKVITGIINTIHIEYLDGSFIKLTPQAPPRCQLTKDTVEPKFEVCLDGVHLAYFRTEKQARLQYYCK